MNSLLIFPDELSGPVKASFSGDRAREIIRLYELESGARLAVSVLGGMCGQADVVSVDKDNLELYLNLDRKPPAKLPIIAIVAVPRPQTVKKALQVAATMGLQELHFVKTGNTIKSYLQSHSLYKENINRELYLGLEQVWDAVPPEVVVHKNFNRFCSEFLPTHLKQLNFEDSVKLLADTRTEQSTTLLSFKEQLHSASSCIAIGPEAGWTDDELDTFKALGFSAFSLGERMLRVETALTASVAQLSLFL